MRPLIVGQAPGPGTDPREPLSGASGRRLAALCGIDLGRFLDLFDRVNLVDRFPGKLAKGDAFPIARARRSALAVSRLFAGRKVVLLGRGVARAFDVGEILPVGGFVPMWGGHVASLPHPSGVNRWWNDPSNCSAARHFWTLLAIEASR